MDAILNKTSINLLNKASKLLQANNLPILPPLLYTDGEYTKVIIKHVDNIPDFLEVSILKSSYTSAKFNELFQRSLLAALLYINPETFPKNSK